MFIDDVTIKVKAGNGGHGVIILKQKKKVLGPPGANGGKGGSVYLEGVSDISALTQFYYKKEFSAENGKHGKTLYDGFNGEDLVLKVPTGTVVHNLSTGKDDEIILIGQRLLLAKGGEGGKGETDSIPFARKNSSKIREGLSGEECEARLELKIIADVGFVGLPNIGKSSLLNRITSAKSKVANYPFTTLDPNLGVYYGLILADIPGLIEGASEGKGLGIKILRHIERTKTLFHFISSESKDPMEDYKVVRGELEKYNKDLLTKKEYIILSKTDLFDKKEIEKKVNILKKIKKEVISISIIDDESIKRVEEILRELIREKHVKTSD